MRFPEKVPPVPTSFAISNEITIIETNSKPIPTDQAPIIAVDTAPYKTLCSSTIFTALSSQNSVQSRPVLSVPISPSLNSHFQEFPTEKLKEIISNALNKRSLAARQHHSLPPTAVSSASARGEVLLTQGSNLHATEISCDSRSSVPMFSPPTQSNLHATEISCDRRSSVPVFSPPTESNLHATEISCDRRSSVPVFSPPTESTRKRTHLPVATSEASKKPKLSVAEYCQRRPSQDAATSDDTCTGGVSSPQALFTQRYSSPQLAVGSNSPSLSPMSQGSPPCLPSHGRPVPVNATTAESRNLPRSPPYSCGVAVAVDSQGHPPTVQDPRQSGRVAVATARSSNVFEPRLGSRECLSEFDFRAIGVRFISGDIATYVLQWSPCWFATQRRTKKVAPICETYRYVKFAYNNDAEYYNTYVRMLFLDMWMRMDAAQETSPALSTELVMGDELNLHYTVKCCLNDRTVLPKREDIILCACRATTTGRIQQIFGHVLSVSTSLVISKPPSDVGPMNGSVVVQKVKIEFRCVEPLQCQVEDKVDLKVLCNVRLAKLQNEALHNPSDLVRSLVVNPKSFASDIDLLRFLPGHDVKTIRDKILYSVSCSSTKAVLVNTGALKCDLVDLLANLAYQLSGKNRNSSGRNSSNCLVLVCLRTEKHLTKLAKRLQLYDPVVAVRQQEMLQPLEKELVKFSLQQQLTTKRVSEIYGSGANITLTLYTAALLSELKDLFRRRGVICILAEAETCTEVETALPLAYGVRKMILLGRPGEEVRVPHVLRYYRYTMSLFQRLFVSQGTS